MINLFFGRISHMDPLPTSDVGDHRILRLIVSYDLRPSGAAPYSRPCNTATFTAKRGIYCGGGGVGLGFFAKMTCLLTPCNKAIATVASIHQCVSNCLRWPLCYLPYQIVLQFCPTNPMHQSCPTREFRNYRPTSPASFQVQE